MAKDPRKTQDEHPKQPPAEEGRREAERPGGTRRDMPDKAPRRED